MFIFLDIPTKAENFQRTTGDVTGSIAQQKPSKNEKDGGYKINGYLNLHGVIKSIDFDIDTSGGNRKRMITLLLKEY